MSVQSRSEKSTEANQDLREWKLSSLRSPHRIKAFILSDLHIRQDAPSARAEKSNWLSILKGYIQQVRVAVLETESAQVIVAGDFFHDGWRTNKCSPELINFCLDNFRIFGRKIYSIPGQHDLPHHRLSDIHKSVYWTLTKCKVLTDISNTYTDLIATNMRTYGIPWSSEIDKRKHEDMFKIAVLHRYVWREGHVHPGADNKDNVHVVMCDLERLGYTHGIAGDNHSGFLEGNFLVPGAFYRSRADEKDYKPAIGAIYEDGSMVRYFLDVANDEFVDDQELAILLTKGNADTSELIDCLQNYKEVSTDFFDQVAFYAKKNRASDNVKRIIAQIKDKAGEK